VFAVTGEGYVSDIRDKKFFSNFSVGVSSVVVCAAGEYNSGHLKGTARTAL